MSYGVTVSLDITNGAAKDYEDLYALLEKDGLARKVKAKNEHTLPTTTLYGEFNGASASAIVDHVGLKIEAAFTAIGKSGKVFTFVGGTDHNWGIRYPKNA